MLSSRQIQLRWAYSSSAPRGALLIMLCSPPPLGRSGDRCKCQEITLLLGLDNLI